MALPRAVQHHVVRPAQVHGCCLPVLLHLGRQHQLVGRPDLEGERQRLDASAQRDRLGKGHSEPRRVPACISPGSQMAEPSWHQCWQIQLVMTDLFMTGTFLSQLQLCTVLCARSMAVL